MRRSCIELTGDRLFREGERFYIHKSNELPEFIEILHKHDFIEISCLISGECTHISGESRVKLTRGDVLIINSETPHRNILTRGAEEFVAYDIAFTPDFIDSELIGSRSFADLNRSFLFRSLFTVKDALAPDIHLTGVARGEFTQLCAKMHAEYTAAAPGYGELIRAYLIEFIVKSFRLLSERADALSDEKRSEIDMALAYLRENYNTDIRLEDVALKVMLSKFYFDALFREVTGTGCLQYIHRLRIDRACELLVTTDRSAESIAAEVGYRNRKSFYTQFRRQKSLTPGEYRRLYAHA